MSAMDIIDAMPKHERHALLRHLMDSDHIRSRAERVVEAARDLERFLHKTVGGPDAGVSIVGDDLHCAAIRDRLDALRVLIAEFDTVTDIVTDKRRGGA